MWIHSAHLSRATQFAPLFYLLHSTYSAVILEELTRTNAKLTPTLRSSSPTIFKAEIRAAGVIGVRGVWKSAKTHKHVTCQKYSYEVNHIFKNTQTQVSRSRNFYTTAARKSCPIARNQLVKKFLSLLMLDSNRHILTAILQAKLD